MSSHKFISDQSFKSMISSFICIFLKTLFSLFWHFGKRHLWVTHHSVMKAYALIMSWWTMDQLQNKWHHLGLHSLNLHSYRTALLYRFHCICHFWWWLIITRHWSCWHIFYFQFEHLTLWTKDIFTWKLTAIKKFDKCTIAKVTTVCMRVVPQCVITAVR